MLCISYLYHVLLHWVYDMFDAFEMPMSVLSIVLSYVTVFIKFVCNCHVYSYATFWLFMFGYTFGSLLLQYTYFTCNNGHICTKSIIQPKKIAANYDPNTDSYPFYAPYFGKKPNRPSNHGFFTATNICTASTIAMITTELSIRNISPSGIEYHTNMYFTSITEYGLLNILLDFVISVILEHILEYYWHRLMHVRWFYVHLHKFHHYYKAPQPFDDLYMHPIEGLGYYCILFSPPYIMSQYHVLSYILYMTLMGVCGVLDHCGVFFKFKIQFKVPWLDCYINVPVYNTQDHDNHHLLFDINYGFPFAIMDYLHGTHTSSYTVHAGPKSGDKKLH